MNKTDKKTKKSFNLSVSRISCLIIIGKQVIMIFENGGI